MYNKKYRTHDPDAFTEVNHRVSCLHKEGVPLLTERLMQAHVRTSDVCVD